MFEIQQCYSDAEKQASYDKLEEMVMGIWGLFLFCHLMRDAQGNTVTLLCCFHTSEIEAIVLILLEAFSQVPIYAYVPLSLLTFWLCYL